MDYSHSILSLAVPIVVIGMVFITRKITLSLFIGIMLGGIMMHYNEPLKIATYTYHSISKVFYSFEEGLFVPNLSSIYIFGFLIILGILTQVILASGAINAFVVWAYKQVKSPQSSEFIAFIAGIVIFIDDYFNALTVGQISKGLNDANKSSRERLSYIIDSTSAPVCILMPISSWGAYIIGVLDDNIPREYGDSLMLLISSIWSNYYAWFALLGVCLTIIWQINLKAMQKYINVDVKDLYSGVNSNSKSISSVWLLIIPIVALILAISFMILYTGYKASLDDNLEINMINILSNTNTSFSLFYGGLLALIISFLLSIKYIKRGFVNIFKNGFLSMLPAIIILVLAWAIGPVIRDDMQSGIYLAYISKDFISGDNVAFIPAVIFIVSSFIAFATGTSWGTFAIMIPIGVSVITSNGGDMVMCISAILAGAVFGDHSSPISDTTILSSIGAGCSVQSHFITQLPYVVSVACVSFLSFALSGYFNSVFIGYLVGGISLVGLFYYYKKFISKPLAL